LLLETLTDLIKPKSALVAENALLRQQLIILRRQSKRPVCTKRDRRLLVLLARATRSWRQALLIVQEDDPSAMAPSGLSSFLEAPVESDFE
jgi:putative transposase